MKRLNVYSQYHFDMEMLKNGWKDGIPENVAVISICNVNDPEMTHFYKDNAPNILNIDFNDCGEGEEGALDIDTAGIITDFIDMNIGKDFYIHCQAGRSRSQGVARYILDMFPEHEYKTRINNPCTTPNYHVVAMLKRTRFYIDEGA